MRNSMKQNTAYQTSNMILMHFLTVFLMFMLGMMGFFALMIKPVWSECISVILMAIYSAVIYSRAKKFGTIDAKPYTPMKPRMYKGFLFGFCIMLTTAAVYIFMKYAWSVQESNTLLTVVGNILFILWAFPYYGITGLSQGNIMGYSLVIMLILPIAVCGVGYIMGCKNKNFIPEDWMRIMYEKKDNDKDVKKR